jgi:hypothetical protein
MWTQWKRHDATHISRPPVPADKIVRVRLASGDCMTVKAGSVSWSSAALDVIVEYKEELEYDD